jgi:membrane protein DedA with SNARE-associated domain
VSEWLHGIVQGHGAWLVGVIIFLESMGLPLPGESLLVACALYAATHGGLRIEWVVGCAAIGAIMGDNAGYLIGQTVGRRALIRWGGKVGLTPARVHLGEYLFKHHGPKVVFLGRFTAFLRTVVALLAGAVRMPWPHFLLWNALGGIAWTCLYGFGAYALGDQVHKLLGPVGITLGILGLGAIVAVGVFIHRNEKRLLDEARAEMNQATPPTGKTLQPRPAD